MSAGILMYHQGDAGIIAFLVDPAGPFWRNRDRGSGSVPKRELDDHEGPEAGARRELTEELGIQLTARSGRLAGFVNVVASWLWPLRRKEPLSSALSAATTSPSIGLPEPVA